MKFVKVFFVISLILTSYQSYAQTLVAPSETHRISVDRLERYRSFLQSEVDQERIAGAVALIQQQGKTIMHESFGWSDKDDSKLMQKESQFYIQSMTKPIISVAFMLLFEEGHFLLSDPVAQYLPKLANVKVSTDPSLGKEGPTEDLNTPITIAQLLSHTAGFSHGLGSTQLDQEIFQALYGQPHETVEDRVNALLDFPLMHQPGTAWYYSAAPDILSLLIEKFSGISTAEFIQKRIFDPLGMTSTGYNATPSSPSTRVYKDGPNDTLEEATDWQPKRAANTVFGGTHGLFSTASDYARFCQMLLDGGRASGAQIISPKTIQLMTLNHVGEMRGKNGQGFGLGFGTNDNIAASIMIGSEGSYYWNGAFCTHFFVDPEEELISILMTQKVPYSGYYGEKMRQFTYQALVEK